MSVSDPAGSLRTIMIGLLEMGGASRPPQSPSAPRPGKAVPLRDCRYFDSHHELVVPVHGRSQRLERGQHEALAEPPLLRGAQVRIADDAGDRLAPYDAVRADRLRQRVERADLDDRN